MVSRRCYAYRALQFLSTTLLLGPLISASASFLLSIEISWDFTGLPGLLTGDYVPVDALDEALDELAIELFPFFIGCVAGFTVCDICSVLNLGDIPVTVSVVVLDALSDELEGQLDISQASLRTDVGPLRRHVPSGRPVDMTTRESSVVNIAKLALL